MRYVNKAPYINARFLSQPITGTQRFAMELCRGIKKLSPNSVFVAPNSVLHKDIADELEVRQIGHIKRGILWEQIELPLYLNSIGCPLLINLCNVAPLHYNNNLVSILDLSFFLHPEWFSTEFKMLYNYVIPRVARKARRIITISENSKHDIHSNFEIDQQKIDIVYPSVSSIFSRSRNNELVNKYGVYILAVSSLDPRKNFKGLIEAFNKINLPDVKLVIVGSEHKVFANSDLKSLVKNNDNIIFSGYVDDKELVGLYCNATLFAYPSFFEGFGIPPLEAMACGCPTLVSNTTSLPEVCGNASIYVDPYNVDSIRDGIVKILTDEALRKVLIRRGFDQVEKYSWEVSSLRMMSIINELL